MLYDRGYEVVRLRRIRIGRLTDHKLPPGAWRPLSQKECAQLAGKPAKK
jgi:16S rRNA U516 pseudouridylate synthase RsuA-like enzyme